MNIAVNFKVGITDASKNALDLTLSMARLSKRKMTMLLPRVSLHCLKILDCIAAVRIKGTCKPIDRGGDELNRGTTRRGQQDLFRDRIDIQLNAEFTKLVQSRVVKL